MQTNHLAALEKTVGDRKTKHAFSRKNKEKRVSFQQP